MLKFPLPSFVLFLVAFTFSTSVSAQDFQGEATYVTKRKFSFDLSGTQLSEERKKMIQERMNQFSESTHKLTFNRTASVYQAEQSLAPQGMSGARGGMRMQMMGSFDSGKLYVDLAAQQYTQETELMGKFFLIRDSLDRPQWKMTQETKTIGQYTCYKATYTQTVRRPAFLAGKRPKPSEEPPVEEIEMEIVAWYTPQIPVSMGPDQLTGLPGLILEVNDGNSTTLCTQVVINPEEKKEIKAPKKGKLVDQKTFEKIQEERMKEMRERFRGGPGGGRGERIIIRG